MTNKTQVQNLDSYTQGIKDYMSQCITVSDKVQLPEGCDRILAESEKTISGYILQSILESHGTTLTQKEKSEYCGSHASFNRHYEGFKEYLKQNPITSDTLLKYLDVSNYEVPLAKKFLSLWIDKKITLEQFLQYLQYILSNGHILQTYLIQLLSSIPLHSMAIFPESSNLEEYNAKLLIYEIKIYYSPIIRVLFQTYIQNKYTIPVNLEALNLGVNKQLRILYPTSIELDLFDKALNSKTISQPCGEVNEYHLEKTLFKGNLKKFKKYLVHYEKLVEILDRDKKRFDSLINYLKQTK